MLITHTESAGQFAELQSVAKISGKDVVLVTVVRGIFIVKHVFISRTIGTNISVVVRSVVAEDILHAHLHRVCLGYWRGIVHLQGMLHASSVIIAALITKSVHKRQPVIGHLHYVVSRIIVAFVRSTVQLIR